MSDVMNRFGEYTAQFLGYLPLLLLIAAFVSAIVGLVWDGPGSPSA